LNNLIILALFSTYSGVSGGAYLIFVFLFSINAHRVKFSYFDLGLLFAAIVFFFVKFNELGFIDSLILTKYSFGFLLFFFYFKQEWFSHNKKIEVWLRLLIIFVIIEALLINTVMSPKDFLHFPNEHLKFMLNHEGYLRPYSIGGNATITGALIVTLLSLMNLELGKTPHKVNKNIMYFFTLLSIILVSSGTVFLALAIYLVFHWTRIGITVVLLFVLFLQSSYFEYFPILEKISFEYVGSIVVHMYSQIEGYFLIYDYSFKGIIFGNSGESLLLGGDIAIFNYIYYTGFFGILIYLSVIFSGTNRANIIPIILLLFGSMHYGTIFSTPGQIVFAFMISNLQKTIKSNKILNVKTNNNFNHKKVLT
jgi:hypothetical protein